VRPLVTWSLPRVLGAAFAWIVGVVGISLLTPPGRVLVRLYVELQASPEAQMNADLPVTALKIFFAVVPLLAFGPPAGLLIAWLRAHRPEGGTPAA